MHRNPQDILISSTNILEKLALWVEGRFNPPWVKSQLEILDARREAFGFQDQNGGMNVKFGAGNDYSAL